MNLSLPPEARKIWEREHENRERKSRTKPRQKRPQRLLMRVCVKASVVAATQQNESTARAESGRAYLAGRVGALAH